MPSRQSSRLSRLPRIWLMTDERIGGASPDDALWVALARLPSGAGVVFRHHKTGTDERRQLLHQVERVCQRRRLLLVVAGVPLRSGRYPTHGRRNSLTWPAHSRREAIAAMRAGARLVFVSPVFATRSHPGAPPLGPLRAAPIVRGLPMIAIALGGMDARRFRRLRGLGFDGWAGIDAWSPLPLSPRRQNRKAVPT